MTMSPSDAQRIEAETHQIKEAVADLFAEWADLENRHAVILETIIGDPNIAFRIYFAPSNAETRLKIADAAIVGMIDAKIAMDPAISARLLQSWADIQACVHRLKSTRNSVAHGSVGHIVTQRKTHVRWTSPKFDISRYGKPGQIDGLSANDIKNCATALKRAVGYLWGFNDLLRGIKGEHTTPLPQILDELERDLRTAALQSNGPTKKAQSTPPQSSRA